MFLHTLPKTLLQSQSPLASNSNPGRSSQLPKGLHEVGVTKLLPSSRSAARGFLPWMPCPCSVFGHRLVLHPSCLSAYLNVSPAWSWGQTLDSSCLCQLLTPSSYILGDRSTKVFFKGTFHILFRVGESELTFTL